MKRRAYAVLCAIAVLLTGITARLWMLSRDGFWKTVAVEQSSRTQVIAVSRGTIYDRYRRPLVNRRYGVMASVAPFEPMRQALEENDEQEAAQYVRQLAERGERVIVPLKSWLPPTSGIAQVWAPDRYGVAALAPHLIGYINGHSEGVSGIEKAFDDTLSRFSGEASVTYGVDALGHASLQNGTVVSNSLQQAKGGVVLTLDTQIQAIAQAAATSAVERGAVLISSAETGELLASVSVPLFDPDHVEEALASEQSPLLDRTRINYDLGSVFKVITAMAALENGVSRDKVYTCHGYCQYGSVRLYCHNPLGHGELTMDEALACSCNTYFMQLAEEVGADVLLTMAKRAGFDRPLSITDGYETARALLPSSDDLVPRAALANFAIGQGVLMATPVHVQALMTALVGEGVWRVPSVYKETVDETGTTVERGTVDRGERLVSASVAASLCSMLSGVVESGTGHTAKPSVLSAAGKTGTAETGWERDGETVVQSWFTGVYPRESPQYVITVLSENGGNNGCAAAPLFRTLCEELFAAGLVENPT